LLFLFLTMFSLSLNEHLRLSFEHVVHGYEAHTDAARRLNRRAWQLKSAVLAALALTTAAAIGVAVRGGALAIAAAVFGGLAFVAYAVQVAVDFERRVYAHRWSAAQMWLIGEKYRALLSEIHDGRIEGAAIGERRDALMREVHAVHEHAPPADRHAYRAARKAFSSGQPVDLSEQAARPAAT
jgi:hypothetical protein